MLCYTSGHHVCVLSITQLRRTEEEFCVCMGKFMTALCHSPPQVPSFSRLGSVEQNVISLPKLNKLSCLDMHMGKYS